MTRRVSIDERGDLRRIIELLKEIANRLEAIEDRLGEFNHPITTIQLDGSEADTYHAPGPEPTAH